MVRDPVSGAELEPNAAPHRSEHSGRTFYFESAENKQQFDASPDDYTASARESVKAGYGEAVPVDSPGVQAAE